MGEKLVFESAYGRVELAPTITKQASESTELDHYYNDAVQLYKSWEFSRAEDHCRKILEQDPTYFDAIHLLGITVMQQGQLDEAETLFRHALEIRPKRTDIFRHLAETTHLPVDGQEVEDMEGLLAGDELTDEDRENLHFILAKVYDRAKNYDVAFDHAEQANQLHKTRIPYSSEDTWNTVKNIKQVFTKEFFATRFGKCGIQTDRPVFIVGMPRSGSTMVEQIIATHPDAAGCDELKQMGIFAQRITKAAPNIPVEYAISQIDDKTVQNLASEYLRYLQRIAPNALRTTDKMPHNFFRLGLIAMLLPGARVINTLRNPLDSCLSCYFHQFPEGLHFTHDLRDLGEYYIAYRALMEHWREVLDLPILDVQYENLIDNQEEVSRQIIDFCGLEWDERCLEFYKYGRGVTTSSRLQIRKPLYRGSVDRWKHYADKLKPLRDVINNSPYAVEK